MKIKSLIYLVFLSIQFTFGQSSNKPSLVVLDLESSFSKQEEVPLSNFVNNVKFVALETNDQSIIGRNAHFEVTGEYIIVRDYSTPKHILVFDRKSGKFIKEIGRSGRGPDEYMRFSFIPYQSDKKVFYAVNSLRQLLVYDLQGNFVEIIKTPDYAGTGEPIQLNKYEISYDIMMDDKIFIGYFINFFGMEKNLLALFTKDEVLKIFPNHQALKKMSHGVGGLMNDNHTLYKHDNKINFIEVFSDTLFQLTRDALIPRFYFKMGKYNVTWQINSEMDHLNGMNYFYMRDVAESNKNLFIKIIFKGKTHIGFVDKKTNSVTFCKMNSSEVSGFKDDISGLMDVSAIDITESNEMIYVIKPAELIKWFNNNPEKAELARKTIQWIKDIDEFSNPVVAIGTFKN
jgi:hypothetical protein